MSSSRYAGRHGRARRPVVPHLGRSAVVRTAVKSVAGVGIVLGSGAFVIAPSSAIGDLDVAPTALDATQSLSAVDLLADRGSGDAVASRSAERGEGAASRSGERGEAAAVTAPSKGAKGAAASATGELAVEPVAKPEPEPEPVEEEADTGSAGSTGSTEAQPEEATSTEEESTSTSSGAVQTGGYASQAAAIGLGPNASAVYSAVRNQFPDMTNIGGYRAGDPGDHGSGRAVDIMVTGARGDQVAAWLQQHAGELNIKYLIWKQRIWNPGGSWEYMADRGSTTANHYDHVHVSVY